MNNPISDLYIKFMETIEPFLIKYPYFFGILIGNIIVLGAVFNWKWICEPVGTRFLKFIYEIFGEMGCRVATGILGTIIVLSCIFLWIHEK